MKCNYLTKPAELQGMKQIAGILCKKIVLIADDISLGSAHASTILLGGLLIVRYALHVSD